MTPVIQQSVTFKAKPADLYKLFMDSGKHTAATGMPAKISPKVGGKWSAFGNMLVGKNLALVPGRMIVQSWRSTGWKKGDPDSVLVVTFEKTKEGTAVHLCTYRSASTRPQRCYRRLAEVLLGTLEGLSRQTKTIKLRRMESHPVQRTVSPPNQSCADSRICVTTNDSLYNNSLLGTASAVPYKQQISAALAADFLDFQLLHTLSSLRPPDARFQIDHRFAARLRPIGIAAESPNCVRWPRGRWVVRVAIADR